MADKDKPATDRDKPAQGSAPAGAPIVESVPSVRGGISGLASANAPFLYFDGVGFYGQVSGVGQFTLLGDRQIAVLDDGTIASDKVVTALLRAPLPALAILRDCIDELLTKVALAAAEVPTTGSGPTLN